MLNTYWFAYTFVHFFTVCPGGRTPPANACVLCTDPPATVPHPVGVHAALVDRGTVVGYISIELPSAMSRVLPARRSPGGCTPSSWCTCLMRRRAERTVTAGGARTGRANGRGPAAGGCVGANAGAVRVPRGAFGRTATAGRAGTGGARQQVGVGANGGCIMLPIQGGQLWGRLMQGDQELGTGTRWVRVWVGEWTREMSRRGGCPVCHVEAMWVDWYGPGPHTQGINTRS